MVASQWGVLGNVGKLPLQWSFVVEIRQEINSWAEIYEEKWRRVPTKLEEMVQVHKERKIRGLHRPMLMDGGEGKIRRKYCVDEGIEHQR